MKAVIWIAYHLESPEIVGRYTDMAAKELLSKGHQVVVCRSPEEVSIEIEDADIMLCWRILPEIFAKARKLKWIQFGSAGIDHTLFPELLASNVVLTNLAGIHTSVVAEHVMACTLAFSRKLHLAFHQQSSHIWDRKPFAEGCFDLPGKCMGIIGYGRIGREIGRLAKAFGMRVLGSRRTAEPAEYADEIVPPEDIRKLITESDFLTLVLPLTDMTTALLGETELLQMKPGAYLINVARGQMVDCNALAKLLREGRLGGAALDVFAPEPLPEDSELWDAPNLIITPHTAGSHPGYSVKAFAIFSENLRRFEAGETMVNVFDRSRGY